MPNNDDLITSIREAIGAHGVWKLRLKTAITTGTSTLSPDVVACDDKCDFGRWLYGPTVSDAVRKSPCYEDVRQKHADFHKSVGQILGNALTKKPEEATALLNGVFEDKSKVLVTKMHAWMAELRA